MQQIAQLLIVDLKQLHLYGVLCLSTAPQVSNKACVNFMLHKLLDLQVCT